MSPNPADPKPSFSVTYKRADGEQIADHGWVNDLEYLEYDDEPVELVEEAWERTSVRVFWRVPPALYDCDTDGCDEDAVHWVQDGDGEWSQACEAHLRGPQEPATREVEDGWRMDCSRCDASVLLPPVADQPGHISLTPLNAGWTAPPVLCPVCSIEAPG